MNAQAPTVAQRFAAHDLYRGLYPGSRLARGLRAASYWDGFPASYSAAQVAAGRALIAEPHEWSRLAAVLELMSEDELLAAGS